MPTALPASFGLVGHEAAGLSVEQVRIPVAQLARRIRKRQRGHVEEVRGVFSACARHEPIFHPLRHDACVDALVVEKAPAVVQHGLKQCAVTQRAESAVGVGGHAGLVTAGQPDGAVGVGQELGVVAALRQLCADQPVRLRRQGGDLVVELVVFERVVIVGQEIRGRGAQRGAVQPADLVIAHAREDGFVLRVRHRHRCIDRTAKLGPHQFAHLACEGLVLRGLQIPVDVVAVGDDGIWCKRHAACQQAPARGHVEPRGLAGQGWAVITAGTGVGQDAQSRGRGIR